MAYSGCCTILVGYAHATDAWVCSGCDKQIKIQPYDSGRGSGFLPPLYQVNGSNKMDVVEWVHRWTGFELEDIKVVIT